MLKHRINTALCGALAAGQVLVAPAASADRVRDRSRPVRLKGPGITAGVRSAGHAGPTVDLRGAVAAVPVFRQPFRWSTVTVNDGRRPGPSSFRMILPSSIPVPFRRSQIIAVKIREYRSHRWTGTQEAVITDAAGRLLMATSTTSNISFLPGWRFERGRAAKTTKERRGRGHVTRYTFFTHLCLKAQCAVIRSNTWRRLATPQGSYFVTAWWEQTRYVDTHPSPGGGSGDRKGFGIVRSVQKAR